MAIEKFILNVYGMGTFDAVLRHNLSLLNRRTALAYLFPLLRKDVAAPVLSPRDALPGPPLMASPRGIRRDLAFGT